MTVIEQSSPHPRRRRRRRGKRRKSAIKSANQLPQALYPIVGAFRASTSFCRNSRSKRISAASASSSMRSRARSVGSHAGVGATVGH